MVVFEPRVEFVFASEAPHEDIQGILFDVPLEDQLETTGVEPELLDKPETVELDPFAEGLVGVDASAGKQLVVVTLLCVPTAGMAIDPGSSLEGNVEIVL